LILAHSETQINFRGDAPDVRSLFAFLDFLCENRHFFASGKTMKIIDLYSKLKTASKNSGLTGYGFIDEDLAPIEKLLRNWEIDIESTRVWFDSPQARSQEKLALHHIQQIPEIVRTVESAFGAELPGTVLLAPSYNEFDGFARYDRGEHVVLLGIDFPDADADYLRALTAHELSHVYRDHAPEVWRHLGKPLSQISRREYLNAATAQEHLVSEGLATLFSQYLYPEIPPVVHHYYFENEWQWCQDHHDKIHHSLLESLQKDEDVWSYYSESRVAPGSPSRTQYYWAAHRINERLKNSPNPMKDLVDLHRKRATEFEEFQK